MSDYDSELEVTRAALGPTLEATAAILPWVTKPRKLRFPPELSKRWQAVCDRLASLWSDRHGDGLPGMRPAVFELYGIALELGDADCLRLSEALASATDRLDEPEQVGNPRLVAALSATFECLSGPDSLEKPLFPDRARHFAERLEHCADPLSLAHAGLQRSPVVDRLFVEEAGDWLEHIHEALAMLPPDAYATKLAVEEIVCLAEHIDLDGISALAGRLLRFLAPRGGEHVDLDEEKTRAAILALLTELESAVAAIAQT